MREMIKKILPQDARNNIRPYLYFMQRSLVKPMAPLRQCGRLPEFLIIGAQKAGTTTLYDVITQHPEIHSARTKELAFFDRHYGRGMAWYKANFPRAVGITGEATPDYIVDPAVPDRVKAALPDAKFVVLLRNPVDRAISHYFHAVRLGYEKRSIEDALSVENIPDPSSATRFVGHSLERRSAYQAFSYLDRGCYSKQLATWFELFEPEQFHIAFSEDFFADPVPVVRGVLSFLEVPTGWDFDVRPKNIGTYGNKVPAELYEQLGRFYADDRRDLEELLGRSAPWPS